MNFNLIFIEKLIDFYCKILIELSFKNIDINEFYFHEIRLHKYEIRCHFHEIGIHNEDI